MQNVYVVPGRPITVFENENDAIDYANAIGSDVETCALRDREDALELLDASAAEDFTLPDFGHISEDQSPETIAEQVEAAYRREERNLWSKKYPYTNERGETVWACCESSIGPTCKHHAQFKLTADDVDDLSVGARINVPAGPHGEEVWLRGADFDLDAIEALKRGDTVEVDGFTFSADFNHKED